MDLTPAFTNELRHATLELHKALLDAQRIRYERDHGRIQTSSEFLGLVLEHPSFSWLRSLSALIAQLDEWLEEREERGEEELRALVEALRGLLATDSTNAAFSKPYRELVDAVPEVLVEHVKLWRLLESARG
jgi:hypothetical protein